MKLVPYIRLDADEAELLRAALVWIRIAFPEREPGGERPSEVRALNTISGGPNARRGTTGEPASLALYARARNGLNLLLEKCEEESAPGYWMAQLPNDIRARAEAEGGRGMATPDTMIRVLVDARKTAVPVVREALQVVEAAQLLAQDYDVERAR